MPSTPSAGRSTTSQTTAAPARSGRSSSTAGAPISTRSTGAAWPRGCATLAGPVRDFGLKREDFQAVIDGMAMDAVEDIVAPDAAMLDLYCDRVASAVGRLSVRIFGLPEPMACGWRGTRAGHCNSPTSSGTSTRMRARPPLPAAGEAGGDRLVDPTPAQAIAHPRIGEVCASLAREAEDHYRETWAIIARSPRRATKAARLMAAAYHLYLKAVVARGCIRPVPG